MQNKHKLAVALGLLALLGTVEVAQARKVSFGGTRSAVARACIGPSRELTSGLDSRGLYWSMCTDSVRMTSVICDELGECLGHVPRVSTTTTPPNKPRGSDYQVPKSLSEQSSGGGAVAVDPPAFEPEVVIIH